MFARDDDAVAAPGKAGHQDGGDSEHEWRRMSASTSVLIDAMLTGAPAEYRTPATRPTLEEAQAWCQQLGDDALRELSCGDVLSAEAAAAAL